MGMKLRWKKNPRPLGLAGVVAGPQGSKLWDGQDKYANTSYSERRHNHSGQDGWYWVSCRDTTGEHVNTCGTPVQTEAEAKAEAIAWVKKQLEND